MTKFNLVLTAVLSLVLLATPFEGAFAVSIDSYKPVRFAGTATTTTGVPEDSATIEISDIVAANNMNLAITGIDMLIRFEAGHSRPSDGPRGCIITVLRSSADVPPASARNIISHETYQSESFHYTFNPPILVTDDLTLSVAALGGNDYCVVQSGFRARLE